MKKLILLNGGKNAGKTTATEHLMARFDLVERQVKDRLHELTMSFFSINEDQYWDIYQDKEQKELPSSLFKLTNDAYINLMAYLHPSEHITKPPFDAIVDISIREAMIYVSEFIVKPAFGKEYLGQYRIDSMGENESAIDDSAGFEEELYPAIKSLGQENILLIRVRGRGDNKHDSRSFIPDGVIDNTIDIENIAELDLFLEDIYYEVKAFFNGEFAPKEQLGMRA